MADRMWVISCIRTKIIAREALGKRLFELDAGVEPEKSETDWGTGARFSHCSSWKEVGGTDSARTAPSAPDAPRASLNEAPKRHNGTIRLTPPRRSVCAPANVLLSYGRPLLEGNPNDVVPLLAWFSAPGRPAPQSATSRAPVACPAARGAPGRPLPVRRGLSAALVADVNPGRPRRAHTT